MMPLALVPCPFCEPAPERIVFEADLVRGLWDGHPVSAGHLLVVTRRHVATFFDATPAEQAALTAALEPARQAILTRHTPDGFNIGINAGEAAGQTIPHLHVHLIPRYRGDVPDPRGGVRYVIPAKANYLARDAGPVPLQSWSNSSGALPGGTSAGSGGQPPLTPHLIHGGEADPLFPHLVDQLAHARDADLAVGFVMRSGVAQLEPHLQDLLTRGGRLRLLTGDYMTVTDPDALARLLDLGLTGRLELRVFETVHPPQPEWPGPSPTVTFHPKAYLFRHADGSGVAFVGSSNLSESALTTGIEWNYRVVSSAEGSAFTQVVDSFERLFRDPAVVDVTPDWIAAYRRRRTTLPLAAPIDVPPEPPATPPEPHAVQVEALAALTHTRELGYRAGLVVMATGLGKTWLAAFDAAPFARVLFVAHRDEILTQSLRTFRRIRPLARLGLYTGQQKDDADVLFASIQTLGRTAHLDRFARDAFDYIVVDEFHHASAPTYRRLIQHFQPRFLLGLTATPARSDGGDLLALCQENLVYECGLVEGVRRDLLCRFQYFGVPDAVDYTNIPWRNARFDTEELTAHVATRTRAENALTQLQTRGGSRTLAFCVSQRHADFMRDFFKEKGLRAASVHTGASSDPRAASLDDLSAGRLDVICAVDMFNEGLDLPELDTVLMLRPTESQILWLQQFGRGLRRSHDGKELRVIDYIGNHRTFLLKPQTLFQLTPGDRNVMVILDQLRREGRVEIAPGCYVTYDLEGINILQGLLRVGRLREALDRYYDDFVERNDTRPLAVEALHDGFNPRAVRKEHGSWLGWVAGKAGLTREQAQARQRHEPFFNAIEATPMEKSYKMLVLLGMLNADRFPGSMTIDEMADAVLDLASRNPRLLADLGPAATDRTALLKLLQDYPLRVWAEGRGTGGVSYFSLESGRFSTTLTVAAEDHAALRELLRELADWRLADYLLRDKTNNGAEEYILKVSHTAGRPILFLPDRKDHPDLPQGTTAVTIDGAEHEADFVKIALNVVRRSGDPTNRLPDILRSWFGEDAGRPGTQMQVSLTKKDDTWHLRPRGRRQAGLELWRPYMRDQIPPLFGFEFSEAVWHSGFIPSFPGHIFLLVTIDKSGKSSDHKYKDRFLSPTVFQWESQNRTKREGKHGQLIRDHANLGVAVHLFIRKAGKLPGGGAAPFTYCGDVRFQDWEGDQPITVRWSLPEPVAGPQWEALGPELSDNGPATLSSDF